MKGQNCTIIRHDRAGSGRLSPYQKIFKEQISLEISRNQDLGENSTKTRIETCWWWDKHFCIWYLGENSTKTRIETLEKVGTKSDLLI